MNLITDCYPDNIIFEPSKIKHIKLPEVKYEEHDEPNWPMKDQQDL